MSGKELKDKILKSGFSIKEVADSLKISPQDLNSKLRAKSLKADFLGKVVQIISKTAYSEKRTRLFEPIVGTITEADVKYETPDYMQQFLSQQMQLMKMLTEGQLSVSSEVKEAKTIAVEAKSEVVNVAESLARLKDTVSNLGDNSAATIVWIAQNVGPLVNRQPVQVEREVNTLSREAENLRKTGTVFGSGKKSKTKATRT